MHILYCDETNLEPRQGDFFIYGGIAIPCTNALKLSKMVDNIRAEMCVETDFRLKFNPAPTNLDHVKFISLKQRIVEAAIEQGAKLFISLILHDIATNAAEARRNEINRICYHFDCYLTRVTSAGLVLVDRFSDDLIDDHLAEKFSVGLTGLPYSPRKRLNNIIGFHYSAVGQSHFPSIIDIVLGTFRYCINGHTRNDTSAIKTAENVLPILSPMFFREQGSTDISDLGLFFSPKEIRSAKYSEIYNGLRAFLSNNGVPIKRN